VLQFIVDVYLEEGHRMLCCFFYFNGWTGWQCPVKCMFFSSGRERLVP